MFEPLLPELMDLFTIYLVAEEEDPEPNFEPSLIDWDARGGICEFWELVNKNFLEFLFSFLSFSFSLSN